MSNGDVDLARRMLTVAWRRRITVGQVPDVVAPRDAGVVEELGYENHMDDDLVKAEDWLEDREYIVPAHIVAGERSMPGFYTVTQVGMAFMEED